MNIMERFVHAMEHRRSVLIWQHIDLEPGAPWSLSIPEHNMAEVLLGVQGSAKRGELTDIETAPYWHFLHVGAMH